MTLFGLLRRERPRPAGTATHLTVDPASPDAVRVTLSIHDTPHHADRLGEALCMISPGSKIGDTTGAVVPVRRHPHRLTRDEFALLIGEAERHGHAPDGFLEIEALVDLVSGAIVWQPEEGPGVVLPYLDEIVENTFAALVETNLFGEWFCPRAFTRRLPLEA